MVLFKTKINRVTYLIKDEYADNVSISYIHSELFSISCSLFFVCLISKSYKQTNVEFDKETFNSI